jgi:hypothetical protein
VNALQKEIVNAAMNLYFAEGSDAAWLFKEPYQRLKTAVLTYSTAIVGNKCHHHQQAPVVVCLCGSTRFWRYFQAASLDETMAGRIVLSIGAASGTDDDHFGNLPEEEYDRVKANLDELHLRKIDMADEILVLNVDGYVGESTSNEIRYAHKAGKRIRWLFQPDTAVLKRLGLPYESG